MWTTATITSCSRCFTRTASTNEATLLLSPLNTSFGDQTHGGQESRWPCYEHPALGRRSSHLGIVGHSLNGITESPRKRCDIDLMHTRHEEVAAFSAGAEVCFTGNLAVRAGSCGPGNLHLINRLYDAHRSGVPVLAIAAHIPTDVQTLAFRMLPLLTIAGLGFLAVAFVLGLALDLRVKSRWLEEPILAIFPLIGVIACTVLYVAIRLRYSLVPFLCGEAIFAAAFTALASVVLPLHDAVFDHLLGKVRLEGGNAPCETIGQCTNDGCDCDQFECNSAGAANAKRAARRRRDKDHNAADH